MATWNEVATEAPELAREARELLDARKHKTLATLRRDGSPRISGTEAVFVDGDLWFGSMLNARKAQDLRRDPRFALHGGSLDPPEWKADAKLAGRVEEVSDPDRKAAILKATGSGDEPSDEPYHLFRADIAEVVITRLGDPADHLVIESWREGEGSKRIRRR